MEMNDDTADGATDPRPEPFASRLRAFGLVATLCLSANIACAEWAGDEAEYLIDAVYDLRAVNGLTAIPRDLPPLRPCRRRHLRCRQRASVVVGVGLYR